MIPHSRDFSFKRPILCFRDSQFTVSHSLFLHSLFSHLLQDYSLFRTVLHVSLWGSISTITQCPAFRDNYTGCLCLRELIIKSYILHSNHYIIWHPNTFVNCYLYTILGDHYAPWANLSLQHQNIIILNHTCIGPFLVVPLYCETVFQTI